MDYTELLKQLQDEFDRRDKERRKPCPSCGSCPECGRRDTLPWSPYRGYDHLYRPWIVWTGDSTTTTQPIGSFSGSAGSGYADTTTRIG